MAQGLPSKPRWHRLAARLGFLADSIHHLQVRFPLVPCLDTWFHAQCISYGITNKEPPFIGLYPLRPATATPLPPASLSALFSSLSLTVPTTLPNFIVPTPTLTTPLFIFNSSVPTSALDVSYLAASTYTPLIEEVVNGATIKLNVTTLPGVTPTPTLATLVLTDASGDVHTTISALPVSTVALGRPPGSNSGSATLIPYGITSILVAASTCVLTVYGVFR